MSYIEDISKIQNITLRDVINVSKKYISSQYRNSPWWHPEIDHGVSPLKSEEALCCYMAAYGEMHELKCKTTFRTFPFDSIGNFEIVDWGCGQGIGTICLAEMLRDREKLHLLKKVTLIEPSKAALSRAQFNVNKITNGTTRVVPIEDFLPSTDGESGINGISYEYATIVHIFSNILDIPNIDLVRLAQILPHTGFHQYFFCMGPKNDSSNRIELFTKVFNPDTLLQNIDSYYFSVTSDTQKMFSCKATAFEYNNGPLNLEILQYVSDASVLDDYDLELAVGNKMLHPSAAQLIEKIRPYLQTDDIIYYSPDINGDKVDIAILKPNCGIYLIQIFDYDITKYHVDDDNGTLFDENDERIISPILSLKRIKENLITLYLKTTSEKRLDQKNYWSIITSIGFFPNNSTLQSEKCINNHIIKSNCVIVGNDIFASDIKDFLHQIKFFNSNQWFSSNIKSEFIKIISPGWHSYKEGTQRTLTRVQRDLTISSPNTKQKIKGIAGSGKTEVLVQRAVNAQIRTGDTVLILTYNLSLRNYIKFRLSKTRADFAWDKFFITNYHEFIKSTANNLNVDLYGVDFSEEDIFEEVKDKVQQYSAIFIDEIQDYTPGWLTIINKYFLKKDGELVVFGDPEQQIYSNCEKDINGDIKIGVIPGLWNGSLEKGFRFSNGQLTQLAEAFKTAFIKNTDSFVQENQLQFDFDTHISYTIMPDASSNAILRKLEEELNNSGIRIEESANIVVLTESHDMIRELESAYISAHTDCITQTTSESKEQYNSLLSLPWVNGDINNEYFKREISNVRRAKKLHFSMERPGLKLSTIHSYKGWEAETAIVIVEPNCSPSVLYTGITRAKNNLIIISLGNPQYDVFFKSLI